MGVDIHALQGGMGCENVTSNQQVAGSKGTKSHAITKLSSEEFGAIVQANEPFELVLKYTFTRDSMLGHDSIEARFGSVGLPTTIKQADVIFTHISNMIAVKVYLRLTSFEVKLYTCVGRLPVLIVRDGSVHLAFDLSHVRGVCLNFSQYRVDRGQSQPPVDTRSAVTLL